MSIVRDQEILTEVQLGVIEPDDQGATFPSGLWTPTEVLQLLNQRHRDFTRRAKVFVGFAQFTLTANTERFTLPVGFDDLMQVVRLSFFLADGTAREIPPAGAFSADHAISHWSESTSQEVPDAYSDVDIESLTLLFMPASNVGGTVEMHYIPRPPTLDRLGFDGNGYVLTIPAEVAIAMKWGVWADMLSKAGRMQDSARAAYAEARYSEIVELTERLVSGFE